MKTQVLVFLIFFLISFYSDAQKLSNIYGIESDFNIEAGNVSFFNANEITYQISMVSIEFGVFSSSLNFRLEDELLSDETYELMQDITFFDVQCSFTLGALQLGLFIENLLGLNNSDFAIEPVLNRDNGLDMVCFSHEANFLVGVNLVYNF